MSIDEVRDQLHSLIDEVDDIYVLNGLYRTLIAEKRQLKEYEREQARAKAENRNTSRRTQR